MSKLSRTMQQTIKQLERLLIEKRRELYLTPCIAYCIDLTLENFEKKILIHKETIAYVKKITTYIYLRIALISLLHHFIKITDLVRPAITHLVPHIT